MRNISHEIKVKTMEATNGAWQQVCDWVYNRTGQFLLDLSLIDFFNWFNEDNPYYFFGWDSYHNNNIVYHDMKDIMQGE